MCVIVLALSSMPFVISEVHHFGYSIVSFSQVLESKTSTAPANPARNRVTGTQLLQTQPSLSLGHRVESERSVYFPTPIPNHGYQRRLRRADQRSRVLNVRTSRPCLFPRNEFTLSFEDSSLSPVQTVTRIFSPRVSLGRHPTRVLSLPSLIQGSYSVYVHV